MKDEDMPKEGPFGEWPGYFTDANIGETPVMEVSAFITATIRSCSARRR